MRASKYDTGKATADFSKFSRSPANYLFARLSKQANLLDWSSGEAVLSLRFMDSDSPSRLDYQEMDEYQSAEEAMEVLADSDSEGYELELESMTGKGINRLCSELLELKKASDEDFQKNIYSNYSAFLRIFEDFGAIESEVIKMKNHISTQNMLVEELMNSFHSKVILENLENMEDECVEDLDLDFPSWMETRIQNILETLDILMSEHRMEEALVVLEKETQTLQKLQKEKDSFLPIIIPFACTISDWRIRLAEQFASLAGHRRVTWPELCNALFGLCRVGESDRAIVLLLNFFHLQLENSVNELKCTAPFSHGTYILEITKVVFSSISQAARSFVVLFGEASPYNSDLMQWARVQLEVIYHSFDMYVKSISETNFALGLAVEAMNIAFSFCSLLEHQRLSLQSDVIKLLKPCITEVLRMHFDQLRKVVSLFASTDNWVLGKFLISEKLTNKPPLPEMDGKLEYVQLTSSGRKFITLMQMVLDDTLPFHAFHLENLILKGLHDLFDEYTLILERAITIGGHVEECDFPFTISAQKLHQKISILVNCCVLVHFLSTIVQNSFNATIFSSDVVLSEEDKLSSQKELDLWKQAIQEASEHLKSCFCELFVSGFMGHGNSESMKDLTTCCCSNCLAGSSEDPMPSFVFQELFLWLRHLEEQFESILFVEDGMMNSLLNSIIMTVICRLTENWEFLQSTKSHKQSLLDVHFLMEIARIGGYFSDNLMVAALDLLEIMKGKLSTEEFHMNSEISEEGWASNAAKLAIKSLLEAKIADAKSKYNPTVNCLNKCSEDNHEGAQEGMDGSKLNEEHFLGTVESKVRVDGKFIHSMENSTRLKTQIKITKPLQNPVTEAVNYCYDDEGSRSPTIFNSYINDAIVDRLSGTNSIDELNLDDIIIISEKESGRNSDLDTTSTLPENGKLTGIVESESNRVEIQLPSVLENLVPPNGNLEHQDVSVCVSISAVSDVENFAQANKSSDALTGEASHLLQTDDVNYQNDRTEVVDLEMNRCEVQHSEIAFIDECSGADANSTAKNNPLHVLETNGRQERPKQPKAADRMKHFKLRERLKHDQAAADGVGKIKKERTTRPHWQ